MHSVVPIRSTAAEQNSGLLQRFAVNAQIATGADGVAIAIRRGDEIVCEASVGAAPAVGAKLDQSSTLSAQCMRTMAPVVHSCQADGHDPSSVLLAPVIVAGHANGLCAAFSDRA